MNKHDRLVWIDLEMTGLNPQKDGILEIATIITDGQLNEIARGPELIIHQPQELIDCMQKKVFDMHSSSGLLAHVQESTISATQAQELTLSFIKTHCEHGRALLAGNSIWQDKIFLSAYMPEIIAHLHYRIVDVSTIKELIKRWYDLKEPYIKINKHRTLDDIQESIAELRYYRERFFVPS